MINRYVRDLSCKTNIFLYLSTSKIRVRLVPLNMLKPSSNFLTDHFKAVPLLWIIFIFLFHVYLLCRLVYSLWPYGWGCGDDILALLCLMFSCFLSFPMCCPGLDMILDCIDS